MALLTAKQISGVAVALLTRTLVLPNTVTRIPGGEYSGDNGDTVTVRVPTPGVSRTQAARGAAITYDDVTETPVDVQIKHLYHAKKISDEELNFDVVDFARQITQVQVAAVAEGGENELAARMNALAMERDFSLAASAANTEETILQAREDLSIAKVPAGDRFLAVSPQIATRLLSVDKFTKVSEAGTDSALRDAVIGRIYGFTVVESNALTAGTAVAYHRSGFVFANRVPVAPRGANDSSTAEAGGVAMRQIFQYAPDYLSDASVISTFAGAQVVDAARVVKMTTAAA